MTGGISREEAQRIAEEAAQKAAQAAANLWKAAITA